MNHEIPLQIWNTSNALMKVVKRVPLNKAQLGDRAISKKMIYLGLYQLLLFDMSNCEGNKTQDH